MNENQANEFLDFIDLDFQEISNYKLLKGNYKNLTSYLQIALIKKTN